MRTSPSGTQLHDYDSLPDYLKDNEFIQTGYRLPDLPLRDTLRSLFDLHNETGNVWSHLLGGWLGRLVGWLVVDPLHVSAPSPCVRHILSCHLISVAGFALFVALTIWVSRSPPAPLLLARPQLEELWHSAQAHVAALRGTVGGSLPQLSSGWPAAVAHSLQASLLGRVSQLTESVHHIQDSLQDSWQQGVSTLHHSDVLPPRAACLKLSVAARVCVCKAGTSLHACKQARKPCKHSHTFPVRRTGYRWAPTCWQMSCSTA